MIVVKAITGETEAMSPGELVNDAALNGTPRERQLAQIIFALEEMLELVLLDPSEHEGIDPQLSQMQWN